MNAQNEHSTSPPCVLCGHKDTLLRSEGSTLTVWRCPSCGTEFRFPASSTELFVSRGEDTDGNEWTGEFREACFWIQGDAKKQNFVLSEPQKINQWLSAFFGFSARLVFEPNNGFPDDRVANGPTITSAGSLEEIVRWFPELTLEGTRRRFRTNLELAVGEPFWEDRLFGESNELKPFRIGDISLFGHNPCQRCVVPSRDPESGIQSLPSFQKTFMALREKCLPAWADIRRFNHFYRFAINTSIPHAFAGEFLRVGDRLTF